MRDPVNVLAIGLDVALRQELAGEDGCTVTEAEDLAGGLSSAPGVDAIVVHLAGTPPLEVLEILRAAAPRAAVVVVTDPQDAADGTVALHAGAEDHLVHGSIPVGLLPRAVRYAVGMRRLRLELSTQDEATGLPNLRGFQPMAEHHLRMADRTKTPVVFLFVRIEDADPDDRVNVAMAREAASIVLEAVRDSDLPARLAPDTFCVLLTGDAVGAESLVLSRLVEAIAVHNARRDRPWPLSLSVGSALYDPEASDVPGSLSEILENADRRLAEQRAADRSEPR